MKIAHLILGALASLAAEAAMAAIARSSPCLPWVVGAILLVAFVPEHILIWVKFPVWCHLVFLITLGPLVALGAALLSPPRLLAKGRVHLRQRYGSQSVAVPELIHEYFHTEEEVNENHSGRAGRTVPCEGGLLLPVRL